MEPEILETLDTTNPISTRKLLDACGVRDTKAIGSISDTALAFIQLLEKMQAAGHIRLIEHRGWIKRRGHTDAQGKLETKSE